LFVGAADVEAKNFVLGAVLDDGREDGLEVARIDQVPFRFDGFRNHSKL
jgi:hypothetical protein